MKSVGMIAAIYVFTVCPVFAQDFSVAATEPILEVREFEIIYSEFQMAFLPIIIPSGEMFLQTAGSIIPFDQSGFKNRFLKNLIGTLHPVSGSPVYTVFAMEDASSGEVVLFNEDLGELARISRPVRYDSTAWVVAKYGSAVTPYLLALYNPSRMIAEYQIIPTEYYPDHVAALEAQILMETAAPMGMMMSMGGSPVTNLMICITAGTPPSSSMDLELLWPEGFDNEVELYSAENLQSNWIVASEKYPTIGEANLLLSMPATSPESFFRFGDATTDTDGDFLPDARELVVTRSDIGNPDSDFGTIPDGYEYAFGMDPNDSSDETPAAIAAYQLVAGDVDTDGHPQWLETLDGTNPHDRFD